MRQKNRIALVCYGGVSLAVYMHGVTKEIWKLARASRAFHDDDRVTGGSEDVYVRLLTHLRDEAGLSLRVLPDILTGASAGGINAVFLAEAIHSGRSLEPLTELWLDNADIDRLTDKDARPVWRYAKLWAQPLAEYLLRRPGNAVGERRAGNAGRGAHESIPADPRTLVPAPVLGSRHVNLLHDALQAVAGSRAGPPLLPSVSSICSRADFGGHLNAA